MKIEGYRNSEIDIARYRETNTSDNMAEQHRKRIRFFSVGYAVWLVVRGSRCVVRRRLLSSPGPGLLGSGLVWTGQLTATDVGCAIKICVK